MIYGSYDYDKGYKIEYWIFLWFIVLVCYGINERENMV